MESTRSAYFELWLAHRVNMDANRLCYYSVVKLLTVKVVLLEANFSRTFSYVTNLFRETLRNKRKSGSRTLTEQTDHETPRFFQVTSKTGQILKVLSNYFKNKTRNLRNFLKPFQKLNERDPKILSNYFKNKAQGVL